MDTKTVKLNATLRTYFKKHGRSHLPWRGAVDPYRILVSEMMLQQTQVERVLPFYERFLRAFPDSKKLSRVPLRKVLQLWQGLGYNRRAKNLRDAAIAIEREFGGEFPCTAEDIERLPGVGSYTARAVATFAFNQPEIFIETNIRSVFLHHFFRNKNGSISDTTLLPLIAEALRESKMEPRDFYAALMDYGSYLKREGLHNNAQSKHYVQQSKFEGSRRQLRGQILKLLLQKPQNIGAVVTYTGRISKEVARELARLQKEKLIRCHNTRFHIAK